MGNRLFFLFLALLLLTGNVWADESEILDKISSFDRDLMRRSCYSKPEDLQRIIQTYPSEADFYEDLRNAWKSKDATIRYYSLLFTSNFIADMSLVGEDYNTLRNIAQKGRTHYREAILCLQNSGKKEMVPFFCELLKNPKKDFVSCQRIEATLGALVAMREFLAQKEIDFIIPLLKDRRGGIHYYGDMMFPFPLAIDAAETLAGIGTPAAYAHERVFQTLVLPEQWENYDAQKFDMFLETLRNSRPSRKEFGKLVEKSGFYVTPVFQEGLTTDFYLEESYAHNIASVLMKLQPENRMYQFLLVQSCLCLDRNFQPILRGNKETIKTLEEHPSLQSFQEYLEWYLNSEE